MKKNNNIIKKYLMALCLFVMAYAMVGCHSEPHNVQKRFDKYLAEDFEPINWENPSEKDIGKNIAKGVARDVDSLRDGTMSPMEKYGTGEMYCTYTATTGVRDAQVDMNSPVDVFEGMGNLGMKNGNKCVKFLRKNYENDVQGSVVVIKNPTDTTNIDEMERVFKDMNPGSLVRYCGHYNNGNQHRHSQTYLGQGYSENNDSFVPSKRGKTVMAAGYDDLFKYLESDIKKYAKNDGSEHRPVLDSIVIVDIPKIIAYKAKQR